ncbi:hypothetical protein BRD13_03635 [Halobacteriales archaeon SW_5_70_135]|nr:MAG: hypothetical protein BRD13_03635 [Halobacteriales archaeon SW_5_70_135]
MTAGPPLSRQWLTPSAADRTREIFEPFFDDGPCAERSVVAERDWPATERDEAVETFDQFVIGPSRDADVEELLRGTDSLRIVRVAPDGGVDLATLRAS